MARHVEGFSNGIPQSSSWSGLGQVTTGVSRWFRRAQPNLGREADTPPRSVGLTPEVGRCARLNRRPHGRGHRRVMLIIIISRLHTKSAQSARTCAFPGFYHKSVSRVNFATS